jgi:hypothetical protein
VTVLSGQPAHDGNQKPLGPMISAESTTRNVNQVLLDFFGVVGRVGRTDKDVRPQLTIDSSKKRCPSGARWSTQP